MRDRVSLPRIRVRPTAKGMGLVGRFGSRKILRWIGACVRTLEHVGSHGKHSGACVRIGGSLIKRGAIDPDRSSRHDAQVDATAILPCEIDVAYLPGALLEKRGVVRGSKQSTVAVQKLGRRGVGVHPAK